MVSKVTVCEPIHQAIAERLEEVGRSGLRGDTFGPAGVAEWCGLQLVGPASEVEAGFVQLTKNCQIPMAFVSISAAR